MGVEQLVPNPSVQRFDLRVLRGLAGIDKVQIDIAFGTPAQHRTTCKFRPVVRSQTGPWPPY